MDKNGKNIYVIDNKNSRINVFEDDGDDDFIYGSFCDITVIQNCDNNADGANEIGDGQFNDPISIARDALGKFFVVDSDNSRIQIFDDDGEFQSKFGSSDSGIDEYLGSAKGIAIQESTKNILVSDIERDSVSVFDSTGDFLFKFDSFDGNDDFQNPTYMVIDNSEEMLYVTDSGNDRIVIFELVDGTTCPSGTEEIVDGVCFVDEFGSSGDDNGEFDDPSGLAFDSTNNLLYVADTDNNRIQIFEIIDGTTCPSGTEEIVDGVCFVDEFGTLGTGNGNFDAPLGITLDPTNELLFVADSDNNRIQAFNVNPEPIALIPEKPSNLKAFPISPTSVIISWDEPVIDENVPEITGYKIEYKIGSEDFMIITANTASTSTSFIHQGLDSKNVYFYRVYAINSEGTSDSSSIVSVKPEHTTAPAALTATAISPSQIKLSWSPPSETFGQKINGYEIKREIIPGVYDNIGDTDANTRTFIVSNLAIDKTYSFAVSAKIGFGSTEESNAASATPREDSTDTSEEPVTSTAVQMTVSTPPIKLTASVVSSTQINLSWSPPVENGKTPITGYKIEVKKDSNSYTTLVEDTESTTRTYSHTNLVTNTKYTYRVSAINNVGISEPSNEFSATPKSTNVQISPIGKLSIDEGKLLSFTVRLLDNSVKDVVFSLEKNPPAGAKIISNTGMFSWIPSASDAGKTYTFDVVTKKDGLVDRETITITVNGVIGNSQPTPEPEPEPEPKELEIPASFVDETKDPQSYVDRYNNEASYKKWFDDNFAEYESIYQAVGLEEPKVVEKKFGICGPGTKLIEGVCTIVVKPSVKPWWQFW
ncbi:MAG: fibronectin type III domain-containing protein [Nitrosopumilus sp.]|nr:fibronectin type III domain-containing protein [Nitrosopumilus sp.]